MLYKNIKELIGNTPILQIDKSVTGLKNIDVFVKCELFNPFGSLKDRTALGLIEEELEMIKKEGKTVIESSSGNTAKALKVLCATNGVLFKTVTNRIKIPETRDILKILGAEIEELPGLAECPDPSDPNDPIKYIERQIVEDDKYFHTSQYTNLNNPKAHKQTGKEIFEDIGNIDYFFGTLGTTGSSRGIIEYFESVKCDFEKIGIIAEKGDSIPGIRNKDEMYEVGIFDSKIYDKIVSIDSLKALEGMLELNSKVGVLGGPTSGACFKATIDYLKQIDKKLDSPKKAVFVACDRVEGYGSYIRKRMPQIFDSSMKLDSIKVLSKEDMQLAKIIEVSRVEAFIEQKQPLIIDLRGNLAYKNNHIVNSINITDTYFDDLVENGIPFSKENTVLLVCAVGDKSEKYSAFLNKKGLEVYSLEGGITEYKDEGLKLVSSVKRSFI